MTTGDDLLEWSSKVVDGRQRSSLGRQRSSLGRQRSSLGRHLVVKGRQRSSKVVAGFWGGPLGVDRDGGGGPFLLCLRCNIIFRTYKVNLLTGSCLISVMVARGCWKERQAWPWVGVQFSFLLFP